MFFREVIGLSVTLKLSKILASYRVHSNRTQAKKIITNRACAQLDSKQFQEMNFLPLIGCYVVIDTVPRNSIQCIVAVLLNIPVHAV